ncbi:hypothetical protein [Rossellomorea arthrocnemi]|jgi:hypothetical protein|uniref:hypothetical protein n=1 Tax=Rossellomorea arthrocnemi TaxID=2769542 RepID=UPI001918B275|nr:hypothetical protein [Rossellomorea arthrocnemi]
MNSEKNEIERDWKSADLKEEYVNNKTGILTDLDYDGKQASIALFYTGNHHSSGDIDMYNSKKLKKIGKGYRE